MTRLRLADVAVVSVLVRCARRTPGPTTGSSPGAFRGPELP
ncbi:hypothetical protein [Dactylosporangium sp. CA-233914]